MGQQFFFEYDTGGFYDEMFDGPGSVRPQNYHAHLPYMSLRLYFGRKE